MKLNIGLTMSTLQPTVDDVGYGSTFEFDGFQYMRIRLACGGLHVNKPSRYASCVNLKSGTVRLLRYMDPVKLTDAIVNVEYKL